MTFSPDSSPSLRDLKGLIFDLDGTLVDSGLDFAAMRREAGIADGLGLLEHLDTLVSPVERERVSGIIHRHEMQGAAAAVWMPGARPFLQRLLRRGYHVGIVTRNSRAATQLTAEALRMPRVPMITREDAPPKPDPGGLQQLARCWGLAAGELAYVGDYLFDLEAARNAGMRAILYLSAKNLAYADRADLRFEHFDELSAMLLGDRA